MFLCGGFPPHSDRGMEASLFCGSVSSTQEKGEANVEKLCLLYLKPQSWSKKCHLYSYILQMHIWPEVSKCGFTMCPATVLDLWKQRTANFVWWTANSLCHRYPLLYFSPDFLENRNDGRLPCLFPGIPELLDLAWFQESVFKQNSEWLLFSEMLGKTLF